MNKILRRAKQFSEQAERVRELLATAPARIEQAKGIVTLTSGQLQQLRTDVQSSITGLRADTGESITNAVRELNEGGETFALAGYALSGVDLELGLAPRLTAHLERVEEVGIPAIRALLQPNSDRRVIHGVLSALVDAEELAGSNQFNDLHYCEVSVQVGPAPTIRLRWRAEVESSAPTSQPPPLPAGVLAHPATTTVRSPVPAPEPASAFTQSSFFAPRAPVPTAAAVPTPVLVAAPTAVAPASLAPAPSSPHDWKRDSLERFKKMPDLSKQRHSNENAR